MNTKSKDWAAKPTTYLTKDVIFFTLENVLNKL